uniref:Uncharacterized protein n=1 Tax=Chromera velia CCMP2878 TaxID=1169474 RepID=A0A0G4HMG7_9ALVE|eukprot:Cvel_7529.t1-p1 / transcript=Cvel_7529.t1 / gene=Cvel_7529 / organism=Chromera_velia_CCMP2878 / gene_product=hypothetical protein / transcript_product=hypothetical protein / location=Cvel_scaffold396:1534-2402(+) / protein_length=99 / sequence_SO=supercontig / SO=protein_coding / is_pseudo=false
MFVCVSVCFVYQKEIRRDTLERPETACAHLWRVLHGFERKRNCPFIKHARFMKVEDLRSEFKSKYREMLRLPESGNHRDEAGAEEKMGEHKRGKNEAKG